VRGDEADAGGRDLLVGLLEQRGAAARPGIDEAG
jgi:hypothetical protein